MPTEAHLGKILLGRYRPLRLLGAGAHGKVYLAEDLVRGGERVAFKVVEGLIGGGMQGDAQRLLRWFRHPAWAEVLDEGRLGPYDWFQALRYVEGRSLAQLEGAQPAEVVWRFLEDGARVLRALHLRGVIHYDITPGNWLQEGPEHAPRHVLTDGGLAHLGPVSGFARGTPLYLAPEMTEDRPHDHRVDLYALGLIAYRLATGQDAHQGGAGEVLGQRRRGPAPRPRDRRPDLPAALDTLIAALLEPDPARRVADGDDLLGRIRAVRPGTPDVLPAEAVAAATSGPIVGRDAALDRFARSLQALTEHLVGDDGTANPSPPAPEPVLLLEGSPGAGGTRLVREVAAIARRAEIPVMLLAGREGAPDRRNPLRRLVDGLVTLKRPGSGSQAPVALASRGDAGSSERDTHVEGRAIERFLKVVEETARRTPLVLVVEDFPDLPPLAQEAIRVLSRHLLGRADRASGQIPLPLTVVIDLGTEPTAALVNADATDPRRAVLPLPPLGVDEIAALCRDRFPGLDLPQRDLEAMLAATDGLPAQLTALLAEAYRRGDLRRDAGAWSWDLARIASYGPLRRLPPALEEALHAASPALRGWLDRIALADAEIPLAAARTLWTRFGIGDLPASPLISIREHGETVVVALASPALRRSLLGALDGAARRDAAEDLLAALERHPDSRTLLDRIALRGVVGRPEAALALATEHRSTLAQDQRQALQPLLLTLVEGHDHLLHDPACRAQLVALLDRGTEASALARRLAPHVPRSADALPDTLLIAQALESTQDFVAMEALLRAQATTESTDLPARAAVHVGWARALFALRRPADAVAPLKAARLLLAAVHRPRVNTHARLVVEYLKVKANHLFDTERLDAARRTLETALRITRISRTRMLQVTVLNNLGLVHRATSKHRAAERCLERSLRLRLRLGDVGGAITGYVNLALVNLDTGQASLAAANLQTAAGLAMRHARLPQLITVLTHLGAALDQQMSPAAALDCLMRGLRVSSRSDQVQRGAQIAHLLAPLAASTGAHEDARTALLVSARAGRTNAFTDARALHHLSLAQAALALGLPHVARRAVRRAARHAETLQGSSTTLLRLLAAVAETPDASSLLRLADRPEPHARFRTAFALTSRLLHARSGRTLPPASGPVWARFLARPLALNPTERRLVVEILLADPCWTRGAASHATFRRARELLARAGTPMAGARLAALQTLAMAESAAGPRAAAFSASLAAVPIAAPLLPRVLRGVPSEQERAYRLLCGLPTTSALPLTPTDLHALAHVLAPQGQGAASRGARREEALRQVLAATSRMEPSADLEALLDRLTRSTAEITGAQRACVVLVEADPPGQMRVATSITSEGGALTDQDLSHTVIQRVLVSRKSLLLHDAFSDDELLSRPSITTLALRSILCVPMLRDGVLLGVMYADSSAGAGTFDQVDLEVLTLLADQAAAAISTNRLVSKLQRAYAEVRTMQDRLVKSERLRVLGEVSSGVAHEFNNLLTAILARVQLMGLATLEQEQRAHLALIEKATLDAAGVVRRLQTFTRNQRTNAFVNVSVAEVCSDAIEFLRPLWSTRRRHGRPPIAVRLVCDTSLRATGNPTELREVLTNLIKNALDALADCGGAIVVRAEPHDDGLTVSVQDDGPGIPPEVLARVFDPFFTTKGERGTGLGLCLSQRIAEQHGGELTVTSTVGRGTTALLRLPLPTANTAAALPETRGAGETAAADKSVRILIVDDDSDVLRPLCNYLERSGYTVVAAQNGVEALDQLKQGAPDVLLTDIGMPKMDGLELCRRAMALEPRLPVVLMSGWASEVDPARARAAGAQALLAKPFAMQQVAELLGRLSRRTEAPR